MVLLNPSLWCQCCIPSQIETKGVGIWAQVGTIAVFPAWFCFFQIHRVRLLGGIRDNNRKHNVTNFEGRVFLKCICQETYIHSFKKKEKKKKVKRRNLWSFGLCSGLKDIVGRWEVVFGPALNIWKVDFGSL